LTLAAAVVFLNEEELLPGMLASLERQRRSPQLLLLVDDGSDDRSGEIAAAYAARHPYARVFTQARRPGSADRLARAAELIAFQSALAQLESEGLSFDVYAKLDADLELPVDYFARLMHPFENEPRVGIAGSQLSLPGTDGAPRLERSQSWHVRGATKFYRRECLQAIQPLPPILGWDTIDETRAQIHGFMVRSIDFPENPPIHLRATGSYDGVVRGFRRRGAAAWGYGAHPLNVLVSSLVRLRQRPRVVGGLAYLAGWLGACARRAPRVEPDTRRHLRRQQLRRLRTALARPSTT
jgi:biofilm PGA synthesis N-glycosyltransferase PgaC